MANGEQAIVNYERLEITELQEAVKTLNKLYNAILKEPKNDGNNSETQKTLQDC